MGASSDVGSIHIMTEFILGSTNPDGAVAKPSANGLVGIGFPSQYQLQHRAGF